MRQLKTSLDPGSVRNGKGRVFIIEDRCKGCGFCIEYCSRDVLHVSASFNKKGYHPPEVVDMSKCVNCHFCEGLCPEFAIYSVKGTAAA